MQIILLLSRFSGEKSMAYKMYYLLAAIISYLFLSATGYPGVCLQLRVYM